jgi:hypothetical protein
MNAPARATVATSLQRSICKRRSITRRPVMKRALVAMSLSIAPLLLAHTASARDGFRCGNRLVTQGDPMLEVRKKCGDPDFVSQRTERRKIKARTRHVSNGQIIEVGDEETIEILLEEWTYDLGPHRLVRFVDFEDARVCRITTGEYGVRAED